MTIKVGDKLPSATLYRMSADGPEAVTTDDLCAGKKVVLFGLPGAFTPTCSAQHVPGFLSNAGAIKAKGVDTIACMSVNDAFVMGAWAKDQGTGSEVEMLVDGEAAVMGGMNIADEYAFGGSGKLMVKPDRTSPEPWRDVDVLVEGPAVTDAQAVFLNNWAELRVGYRRSIGEYDFNISTTPMAGADFDDGQILASLVIDTLDEPNFPSAGARGGRAGAGSRAPARGDSRGSRCGADRRGTRRRESR